MKAIWAWIVQAVKDVYSFVYTEVGAALSLLKYPAEGTTPVLMKYSVKRVVAVAIAIDILFSGLPVNLFTLLWAVAKVIAVVVLLWIAAATKT